MIYGYSETDGFISGDSLPVGTFLLKQDLYEFCLEYLEFLKIEVVRNSLSISLDPEAVKHLRHKAKDFVIINGVKIYDYEYAAIKDSGGFYYTQSGHLFEGSARQVLDEILQKNFDSYQKTQQLQSIQTIEEFMQCSTLLKSN